MVFLSSWLQFSVSGLTLAKKAKADRLVVLCKSVATGHGRMKARPRLADKLEFIDWDPSIKQAVLYKEEKKVSPRVAALRETRSKRGKVTDKENTPKIEKEAKEGTPKNGTPLIKPSKLGTPKLGTPKVSP